MTSQTITNNTKSDKKSGFFKGVKAEMKKVNWPNRKTLVKHTCVVLVICALMAIFLGLADALFSFLISLIVK